MMLLKIELRAWLLPKEERIDEEKKNRSAYSQFSLFVNHVWGFL